MYWIKKCIPQKFSGRVKFAANLSIEMVEVFDVIIVSLGTAFSISSKTFSFTLFSTTASTTRSVYLKSS